MPRRLPSLAALSLPLLIVGCGETETHTETTYTSGPTPREYADTMERNLLNGFEAAYGLPMTSAECPEIVPNVAGTYACDATAGEVRFEYEVTLTPEPQPDGMERIRLDQVPLGVQFAAAIERRLAEKVQGATGVPVEATCDRPPVWAFTVGERVPCVVRDLRTDQKAVASVTIENERGGARYDLGG